MRRFLWWLAVLLCGALLYECPHALQTLHDEDAADMAVLDRLRAKQK